MVATLQLDVSPAPLQPQYPEQPPSPALANRAQPSHGLSLLSRRTLPLMTFAPQMASSSVLSHGRGHCEAARSLLWIDTFFMSFKQATSHLSMFGYCRHQEQHHKEMTKLAAVIQVPFWSANHFLGEGGVTRQRLVAWLGLSRPRVKFLACSKIPFPFFREVFSHIGSMTVQSRPDCTMLFFRGLVQRQILGIRWTPVGSYSCEYRYWVLELLQRHSVERDWSEWTNCCRITRNRT